MIPIERAIQDMTPWVFDPRVARLELFQDGDQVVARAIVHMDAADQFTRLMVGATGRGATVHDAIIALMTFIEGNAYTQERGQP